MRGKAKARRPLGSDPVGHKILTEIGERVRRLRGSRKQEALARRAKVSRNILSNIETGKNYTSRNLAKVLMALGADLDKDVSIEDLVENQRQLLRRLLEMIQAGDDFSISARSNIDTLYGIYQGRIKRP